MISEPFLALMLDPQADAVPVCVSVESRTACFSNSSLSKHLYVHQVFALSAVICHREINCNCAFADYLPDLFLNSNSNYLIINKAAVYHHKRLVYLKNNISCRK